MRNCSLGFSVKPELSEFTKDSGATLALHAPMGSGVGGVQPKRYQPPEEFPPSR